MDQNENSRGADEKKSSDEQKNSGEKQKDAADSLTHKTAGVAVTVSVKDENEPGETKQDQNEKDRKDAKEKKQPVYKRPAVILIVSAVTAILIVGGILFWLYERQFVSTDDAYIDGYVSQISPRVSAQVIALHIVDNQFVRKGDLLMELDPTDFQVALEQAKAQVASAQGRLALSLSRQQYQHGLSSFLNVLDAERNLYSAQDALAQSDESLATDLVALYKSLGGGWQD